LRIFSALTGSFSTGMAAAFGCDLRCKDRKPATVIDLDQ
jgi:hypothetical protein